MSSFAYLPGVENTRLINGRPTDARFKIWVSASAEDSVEGE